MRWRELAWWMPCSYWFHYSYLMTQWTEWLRGPEWWSRPFPLSGHPQASPPILVGLAASSCPNNRSHTSRSL